jgi:predicted small lipoprotein YifL
MAAWLVLAGGVSACGKKGGPLPPLIRVPVPPADFSAERRGEEVKLQFTVPSANTDGTRPANVERLDIFRFTGPPSATDDQVLKLGTKVASVPVKAPANPDIATDADEPPEEPELKDEGLDQGAVAQLEDTIVPDALKAVVLPKKDRKAVNDTDAALSAPLLGPPVLAGSTLYVIVGINTDGRKGPLSRRVHVPLVAPPKPPPATTITYNETTITVTWTPTPSGVPVQAQPTGDLLHGRTFGLETPTFSYHVYDVSPSAVAASANSGGAQLAGQLRLTPAPIGQTSYADSRIEWGATRCYVVRTVETLGDLTLESDAPAPECQVLEDTFPPAAPKDLRLIATERVISLIWEPSSEKDVAGYLVLRGIAEDTLEPITPEPITATTFSDGVAPGRRYWYVVRAVDRAGNVGPPSNRVDELAR